MDMVNALFLYDRRTDWYISDVDVGWLSIWHISAMNILIGCLIGGFVVLSYILKLVYDVVTFMVKRTWFIVVCEFYKCRESIELELHK